MEMRTLKISEVVRALELGGYTLGRTHLLDTGDGDDRVVDACAMGIMALNLGVDGMALYEELDKVILSNDVSMRDNLTQWVDRDKKPLEAVIKSLSAKSKKVLQLEVTVPIADYGFLTNYHGKRV